MSQAGRYSFREDGVLDSSGTSSTMLHGAGDGRSEHSQYTTGEQHTESTSEGRSETRTTRTVYYPLEGERELMTNLLQKLGNRQCYLYSGALRGTIIETPFVPDELYVYQAVNFPAQLLAWQRCRLRRLTEETEVEQEEPILTRILPFAPAPAAAPKPSTTSSPTESEKESVRGDDQPERHQGNYPFVD